jgi:hypothetical protein
MKQLEDVKEVIQALSYVHAGYWEKYGMRRIYVDVALTYKQAGIRPGKISDQTKFFLDLNDLQWNLTDDEARNDKLISVLNALAGSRTLNSVYENRLARIKTETTPLSELQAMTDKELIALMRQDVMGPYGRNLWAGRISAIKGMSPEIIRQLAFYIDDFWRYSNITGQANFDPELLLKACRKDRWRGSSTGFLAMNSRDPELLHAIASHTRNKGILRNVRENEHVS